MHICIDSSAFILGLLGNDPAATQILELVGSELNLIIPRLIAQEVTRNLVTPEQVRQFYRLFQIALIFKLKQSESTIAPRLKLPFATLSATLRF